MNTKEKLWIEALTVISRILKDNNIPYFLDTGTLLGAVRDESFIPWDNDIDLGVNLDKGPTKKRIKELSAKIYKQGFNVTSTLSKICVKKTYTDIEINIQFYKNNISYYSYKEEFADAIKHKYLALIHSHLTNKIIFKKGQGFRFKYLTVFSNLIKILTFLIPQKVLVFLLRNITIIDFNVKVPKNLLNEYIEFSFYNRFFIVPKEYKAYLKYRYGEWETPIKDYNFLIDDKAIL